MTDDSGAGNLSATVYRLDGSSFTQVLSFPLSYDREVPFQYSGGCDAVKKWKPWISVVPATCADGNIGYPTPLMTDIEFDDNGHMILGFTDRTGFQFGYDNYGLTGTTLYSLYSAGDILKACKSGATWAIESSASGCASAGGLAIGTNDAVGYVMSWGNLAKAGEFYEGDFFHGDGNFDGSGLSYYPGHPEIAIGGLAVVPGSGEVMTTSYDPVTGAPNYNTGGVISLSNTTGKRPRNGFQLYATPTGGVTQGKGVGLGDLEALCDGAAIEIGNRVWNDTDQDGIQDAGENGIASVCLEVFADFNNDGAPDGAALGTSTTDANGAWLFNAANVADGDPSVSGNQAGLQPFKKYLVRVCGSDWTAGEGAGDLAGLALTPSNTDATSNGDERDNDASLSNDIPQIAVTTEAFGISNFSLDMGFRTAPPCTKPTIAGVSADTATCTAGVANSNAALHVTGITGMEKYVYGTNPATLYYANATASTAATIDITGLANPATATTYTIRLFSTDSTCYNDTTIVLNPSVCAANPDLALTKTVNNATTTQGANVVFTIKVKNEGVGAATGVTVHDSLPVGVTFISATPSGVYDANTKLWTIGNIAAGDSVTIAMTIRIDSVGVNYNTAEVHALNETDTDSSPNNGVTTEDDIDRVCVSVPVPLCTAQGKTLALTIPSGYTNIKWFKDNVEIVGQTSNTLTVSAIGSYTFTADESTCPVEGCCPVMVVEGNCDPVCKPIICLPVTVTRAN